LEALRWLNTNAKGVFMNGNQGCHQKIHQKLAQDVRVIFGIRRKNNNEKMDS